MKRMLVWIVAAVVGGALAAPSHAQDAARQGQLLAQIEGRAQSFWPDARVTPSAAALFRGDLADVRAAIEELAMLGDPAVAALTRLLRHPSAHLRANAAYGLGLVGGPATVAPLAGAARDSSAGVRYQVARALGYSGSYAALEPLNRLAGDEQAAVRQEAIRVGGVVRGIIAAEEAPTPEGRIEELVKLTWAPEAAHYLARQYGAAAVPQLVAALDSPDRGAVAGAADVLALIGDPRGLEPLWAHFEASLGGQPQTKFAQALAQFRSPEVWPYLVKLLDSGNVTAQAYALDRMATLEHADRLTVVHGFLNKLLEAGAHREVQRGPETDVSPVAAASALLARIGDASSVTLLDKIISEAPPAEKSIVKPLAEKAKAAIQQRVG